MKTTLKSVHVTWTCATLMYHFPQVLHLPHQLILQSQKSHPMNISFLDHHPQRPTFHLISLRNSIISSNWWIVPLCNSLCWAFVMIIHNQDSYKYHRIIIKNVRNNKDNILPSILTFFFKNSSRRIMLMKLLRIMKALIAATIPSIMMYQQ